MAQELLVHLQTLWYCSRHPLRWFGCTWAWLSPGPSVIVTCGFPIPPLLGPISSYGALEKGSLGGTFSENSHTGKWIYPPLVLIARLAGHHIQGWGSFFFGALKALLHRLLASRTAVWSLKTFLILRVSCLERYRVLFVSPGLWDFRVTCLGAGLFSSILLSP